MLNENEETHCKINSQMKFEEEKEYWQDKVLELKMRERKDFYHLSQSIIKLKDDLEKEGQRNEALTKEFNEIQMKINQMKKNQKNNDDKLISINSDISDIYKKNQDLTTQVKSLTEYLHNLNKTENIVNHFLSFPPEFKQHIYSICTERVNAVLQYTSQMPYRHQPQNSDQEHVQQNGNSVPYKHQSQNSVQEHVQPNGNSNEVKSQIPPNRIDTNYPMVLYPLYHPYHENYPKTQ